MNNYQYQALGFFYYKSAGECTPHFDENPAHEEKLVNE